MDDPTPTGAAGEEKLDRLLAHPRIRKLFERPFTLKRDRNIPYLAGYSKNGEVIYIDKSMPEAFTADRRKTPTDRFLILHERMEKALIDALGWTYLPAHRIAIIAEKRAVQDAGIDWSAYDAFMQGEIKRIREAPVCNVPPDLDLTPYKQEATLLEKIRAARTTSSAGKSGGFSIT